MAREPDQGAAKVATPAADPHSYFELEFLAEANVPYHLWMRMKADNDSYQNDSVWVQFSDSVDAGGNPVWRIGSTDATGVVLEDCSGCGEQGWGWNDNGYGTAGTPVMFATSGWHTIRIQQREDGIAFDQIVLSSSQWANTAPGANKNDATILRQSYAFPIHPAICRRRSRSRTRRTARRSTPDRTSSSPRPPTTATARSRAWISTRAAL